VKVLTYEFLSRLFVEIHSSVGLYLAAWNRPIQVTVSISVLLFAWWLIVS